MKLAGSQIAVVIKADAAGARLVIRGVMLGPKRDTSDGVASESWMKRCRSVCASMRNPRNVVVTDYMLVTTELNAVRKLGAFN